MMLRLLLFSLEILMSIRENGWILLFFPTDGHGFRALDFSSESGCEQIIRKRTNGSDNCLDLLFTDSPGAVAAFVGTPIGTSGHSAICATIKTEQAVPDGSFSRKFFNKSWADLLGISTDLSNVDWPYIYHLSDSVSALDNCFFDMINFKLLWKDKAWFIDVCRKAFLD